MPIVLILFSCLRADHVGTDTMNYMDEGAMSWLAGTSINNFDGNIKLLELSYIFIVKLAYFLSMPRIIITSFSIISIVFLFYSFKKFNCNVIIAYTIYLVLGLFTTSMNYARQLAACSILLYSFSVLIVDGNKLKSFLWIIFASTFHVSSIFYSFVLFIPRFRISRNRLLFVLFLFSFISVIYPINIIALCSRFITLPYLLRYQDLFIQSNAFSLFGMLFKGINYFIIIYIFHKSSNEYYSSKFDILFVVSSVFILLFTSSDPILARISIGMTVLQVVYISKYFTINKFNSQNVVLYIFYLVINAYSVLSSIENGSHELVPYEIL